MSSPIPFISHFLMFFTLLATMHFHFSLDLSLLFHIDPNFITCCCSFFFIVVYVLFASIASCLPINRLVCSVLFSFALNPSFIVINTFHPDLILCKIFTSIYWHKLTIHPYLSYSFTFSISSFSTTIQSYSTLGIHMFQR